MAVGPGTIPEGRGAGMSDYENDDLSNITNLRPTSPTMAALAKLNAARLLPGLAEDDVSNARQLLPMASTRRQAASDLLTEVDVLLGGDEATR